MTRTRVAIIGAGAAGCFCAIHLSQQHPEYEVFVYESGVRPMIKLGLTGAGRCNVTNTFEKVVSLAQVYPRGEKLLKKLFYTFNHESMVKWLDKQGIATFAQDDCRIFPKSNKAQEIVDKFLELMSKNGVRLKTGRKVTRIARQSPDSESSKFEVCFSDSDSQPELFDKVIVTVGGMSKNSFLDSLVELGLKVEEPLPSLFSFKVKSNVLTSMMGAAVANTSTQIAGTKFSAQGPLQITHFGMSGPAILKLSSYASRYLAQTNYKCDLVVNWLNVNEDDCRKLVSELVSRNQNKLVLSAHPQCFTQRLWEYLVSKMEIDPQRKFCELGKKNINKMVSVLVSDIYHISGRGQFKDEFVTSGGVALSEVNSKTLESKNIKNLYFAGEALDIDAITGGFNLQACWTTAYVVATNA